MRTAFTLDQPPARPGHLAPWIEVAAWLLALALLLGAPCAPEPPSGGPARASVRAAAVSGPRGDAPRPP